MGPHCTVRLEHLLVAIWMTLTLEPVKSLCTISTLRLVFLTWWSRSVTFRGCAIQSLGGSWSTILFGQAVCGTLGGGFPEKPLPFECSVRWAFLPWTLLEFQTVSFKAWNRAILDVCGSQSDSSELPLVTPLAFFRSSSCSSGRDIAHGRVFRRWSPLDLDVALELVCCYCLLLVQ